MLPVIKRREEGREEGGKQLSVGFGEDHEGRADLEVEMDKELIVPPPPYSTEVILNLYLYFISLIFY